MADKESTDAVKVKTTSSDDHKVLAAVATIPLVGLIIYYAMPDAAPIVKHYAKQSNGILALNIVTWLLQFILVLIPFLGWLLLVILWITVWVFWILLLINALKLNQDFKLPVIGDYFDKLLK